MASKAFHVMTECIYDDLAAGIRSLGLDSVSAMEVLKFIDIKKESIKLDAPKRKKKTNPDAPKRVISKENRCTRVANNGDACKGPKCDKKLGSCWGHMTKEEKMQYRSKNPKKSKKPHVTPSYRTPAELRALEDEANE